MHAEPAVAFAELGYHVLLEKPMAITEADCWRIVEPVERTGVLLAVCHVMRYSPYTRLVKRLVDAGRLGEVVATGDRGHILSGPRESLAVHLAVFAAERARRAGVVATVPETAN
jgi:predicted dehydrogenase